MTEQETIFRNTYRIIKEIGTGGMSTVYQAEHIRLHSLWAIKKVSKEQPFDFLAESNILKRLHHPMLPVIADIFEDEAYVYLVEDYIEGVTLKEILVEKAPVVEAVALQWFLALCDVLEYLHGQTPHPIIYRDLKPSNIMVQPDGTMKLIDFGIAREYKAEADGDTTLVGTRGYAAPEQFGKNQTDARTDIYSLGVTMYHALTGKSPYDYPYIFLPVRKLNASLSYGIEAVIWKCVRPDPDERFAKVGDVREMLENLPEWNEKYRKEEVQKYFKMNFSRVGILLSVCLIGAGVFLYRKAMQKETAVSAIEETSENLQENTEENQTEAYLHRLCTLFSDKDYEGLHQALLEDYEPYLKDAGALSLSYMDSNGKTLLLYQYAYCYYGDVQDGVRSGNGIWYHALESDYQVYEGEWAQDKPNGSGKLTTRGDGSNSVNAVGEDVEGTFVDGVFEGTMKITDYLLDGTVQDWSPITAVNGYFQAIPDVEIPSWIRDSQDYRQRVAAGGYLVAYCDNDLWTMDREHQYIIFGFEK